MILALSGGEGTLRRQVRGDHAPELVSGEGALKIAVGAEHRGLLLEPPACGEQNDRDVTRRLIRAEEEVEVRVIDSLRQLQQDDIRGEALDCLAQIVGQPRGRENLETMLKVVQPLPHNTNNAGIIREADDARHLIYPSIPNHASTLYNARWCYKVTGSTSL